MHRRRHYRRCGARPGARSDCGESGLTRTVSLLIPGLAADFTGYSAETLPPAPALSLWLRRGDGSPFTATSAEQALTALCGVGDVDTPPVAALSYLEDFGEWPEGYCLRADPVHLRADTSGLILFDAGALELGQDESRSLMETLDAHLREDGWTLRQRDPRRWYLSGGPVQDLKTAPLAQVRGTAVAPTPFRGADAARWVTRLNEIQMLMHNHPVNRARAATGQPAVNSLWLWGGGAATRAGAAQCTGVVADDAFARGSARCSGLGVAPLPDAADQLASPARADERLVVLREDCAAAAAYGDVGAWQQALERLERDWFAPLLRLLRRRRIDRLELLPLNGRQYRLTRAQLRSFWKGSGDYRRETGFRRTAGGGG